MKRKSLKSVLLILLLTVTAVYAGEGYLWPMKLVPDLSSRFCDYRQGHFHAGLDIRTRGKSGYRVYAVGDGYVYRVSMAHNGYGKDISPAWGTISTNTCAEYR